MTLDTLWGLTSFYEKCVLDRKNKKFVFSELRVFLGDEEELTFFKKNVKKNDNS